MNWWQVWTGGKYELVAVTGKYELVNYELVASMNWWQV